MKELFGITLLFVGLCSLWNYGRVAQVGESAEASGQRGFDSRPAQHLTLMPVVEFSPTPTPSGHWVFYKRNKITYYEETGNPTALGNEYITGPMDSLAAVDREDRWLLEKWLLVKWDGGEFVVWAGDICGGCSDHGVALDISPGLYGRKKPPPVVDVYYWEEG